MAINFPTELINSNPSFSLVDVSEVRGTARPINQLSDTGSIQFDERKVGQWVFVTSSMEYWAFFGDDVSSWSDPTKWSFLFNTSGSEGLPTGSNREIQFNDNNLFGASSNFKFLLNNTLSLTGSFSLNSSTSSVPFLINVSGSNGNNEKFKINSEGVLQLGSFDNIPTLVSGGMYYSSSGEYYLAFFDNNEEIVNSVLLNNLTPILLNNNIPNQSILLNS